MIILLHLTTTLWSVWYCSVFTAGEAKAQHRRMTFPEVTCWQVKRLLIDISALEDWENFPHLHVSVRVGLCQGYLGRSQCLFYLSSQPPFLRKLKSRRWMMAPEHRDMGSIAPSWIVLTWDSQASLKKRQEGWGDFQVTFGSDILEPELVCGGGMNLEILMENRLCS